MHVQFQALEENKNPLTGAIFRGFLCWRLWHASNSSRKPRRSQPTIFAPVNNVKAQCRQVGCDDDMDQSFPRAIYSRITSLGTPCRRKCSSSWSLEMSTGLDFVRQRAIATCVQLLQLCFIQRQSKGRSSVPTMSVLCVYWSRPLAYGGQESSLFRRPISISRNLW